MDGDGSTVLSDKAEHRNANTVLNLIIFGFIIGLILLLEMLGWLEGGGLSSLLAADQHMRDQAQLVDLDGSALRTPIMVSLGLIAWIVTQLSRIHMSSRWGGAVLALVVFGGGFVIDGVFEPQIAAKYMASHGYSRCPSRDHHVGNGKSLVWFDNYAESQRACSAGP